MDTLFYWLGLSPFMRRRQLRGALRLARNSTQMNSRPLATVAEALLRASNQGGAAAAARAAWRSIERRRRDLLRRKEDVQIVDYGAGAPDKLFTKEQQQEGVVATISMRHLVSASSDPIWGQMLFHLTQIQEPNAVLELGTCVGISAAYIAAALRINNKGHIWTLEGSAAIGALAQQTFRSVGLNQFVRMSVGPFRSTLASLIHDGVVIARAFGFVDFGRTPSFGFFTA